MYMNAGGLRIGGFDSNPLYNDTKEMGFAALNRVFIRTSLSLSRYPMRFLENTAGNIGIANESPQGYLHVGNCDVAGSEPLFFFGQRKSDSSGSRTFAHYVHLGFLVMLVVLMQMLQQIKLIHFQ
jgi:hypothetical protein